MIAEEDARLFEAAKRAQVSRNTAIHVIEHVDSGRILSGAFVRVLLEMPTRNEGYMIARIHSTTAGEPYSGFSTNPAQTTNMYLMLELPPQLAAINGVQYQLNSVSNSSMGEGEFREWLQLIRNEPTLRVPTVQALGDVAARLHPFEVNRHRAGAHVSASVAGSVATNGRGGVLGSYAAPPPQAPMPPPQQQQPLPGQAPPQQRALSARGAARQQQQRSAAASSQTALISQASYDGRPVAASSDAPLHSPASMGDAGADGNSNNRVVRQGTMMTRDYNRNPREDGQASHEMPDAASQGSGYFPAQQQQQQQQRSSSPRPSASGTAGSGPASAAAIPFMTRGATDHRMESEDEEMERRLRQDIMNHLAQECVLFPKDAQGYKLSRLRLLERDMIEYLQHVRDEIQGKQENCIVCMDHVPTVILLPCKHKVMCRLCAPSCPTCPVCRSKIAEMFEPEEI